MSSREPEFSFGKGRNQISLKGADAIREARWAIRALLVARALAVVLAGSAILTAAWKLYLLF